MPIYEFYCPECHTIFSFLSKTVNTRKTPACPRCKTTKLERQVSLFSATGHADDEGGMDNLPIDESGMEKAMGMLASEAENINEDDPRQAAQLIKKLSAATGLQFGKGMEEAIGRLEAGEDPNQIEKEMGDMLDGDEEPFILPGRKADSSRRPRPPSRDETLHEM